MSDSVTTTGDTTHAISATLPDGDLVQASVQSGQLVVQLQNPDGSSAAPASTTQPGSLTYTQSPTQIVTFADNTFDVAVWGGTAGGESEFDVVRYAADGTELTSTATLTNPVYGGVNQTVSAATVTGIADDGFVVSWLTTLGSNGSTLDYVNVYNSVGVPLAEPVSLGGATTVARITANPDGSYAAAYTAPDGSHTVNFLASSPPGELLPSTLSLPPASPGFSSAAVLSNGDVAIASGPGASGVGMVTTYDASGDVTGSTSLQTFEGETPTLTALAGGFYEVSYANTSNYEVYNTNDQLVFSHNAWSPSGQAFTPLQDGGYTVTTDGSNSVGLVGAGGGVDWVSIPSDAPSGMTPTVTALDGGGFALTYGGTPHFDVFDASGQQTGSGDLGASMSSFATATTATRDGGFAEAWLSADGGRNGLPSSLDIQTFNGSGQATSGPITLTQDLDPWHTQLDLQADPDGSVTAYWSQGGQIWSSQIAKGAAGPARATGVTGSLSDAARVALSNGETGFAFLAYGDAWGEIWDPATGTKTVAELGPGAVGGGSTLHALATTDGGLAVSWDQGSASHVVGSVMGADGQVSGARNLFGDFLGADAKGMAVTAWSDTSAGPPVIQTFAMSGGGFVTG